MNPAIRKAARRILQRPLRVNAVEAGRADDPGFVVIRLHGIPPAIVGVTDADLIFSCDSEYPGGPAWHLMMVTGGPFTRGEVPSGPGHRLEGPSPERRRLEAFFAALLDDLGEGDLELYALDDGSAIHAMRSLRLDERLRMGQSGE